MKKIYDKILELVEKNKDDLVFDFSDMKSKAERHLFGIELKEKYGLNIDPQKIQSLDWNRFGEYMSIGRWGEKHKRTISWSDNDEQPDDEWLLQICFPTGAYIFGEDYPEELFKTFFNELKTYKPSYSDSHNQALYFSLNNASNIFNIFNIILKKYYDLNKADYKVRKIKKMEDELKKLKED